MITEARSAFAQQHARFSFALDLFCHISHVLRREELSLFHIHHLSRRSRSPQQIGLSAQEGGNLQNIDHLRHPLAMPTLVHIGHGEDPFFAQGGKYFERGLESHSSLRCQRCSVRLVERSFVDPRQVSRVANLCDRLASFQCVRVAFHRARTCEQDEGTVVGEDDFSRAAASLALEHDLANVLGSVRGQASGVIFGRAICQDFVRLKTWRSVSGDRRVWSFF